MDNVPNVRSRVLGFTLLELVTTLTIVAVLGAVTLPRLFESRDFAERGYVDELASSLRYAQRIAVASACEVRVTINPGDYAVAQRNLVGLDCSGAWGTPVLRADGSQLAGNAPSGVTIAPAATLVIQPDGSLRNNAPVFTVGPFSLTVDAASGNVSVYP